VEEREPIALFLFFLGEESLSAIVAATNMYANSQITVSHRWADRWSDINIGELLCWIGILFYMAKGTAARRNDYWPILSPWMSHDRWDNIHRYLTFNIDSAFRPQPPFRPEEGDPWWKVEPIWSTVRRNSQRAVAPATWISIDEVMVSYRGRLSYTVKMKNKSITEGYKIWSLGFGGYYYNWLCYSRIDGTESLSHKKSQRYPSYGPTTTVLLTDTFQVLVTLCQQLINRFPHQNYVAFLDNLFLNVLVAHALLKIGVGVMGTTRKNANGLPERFLKLKELEQPLLYGGNICTMVGETLCFAWQDNKIVLCITTTFSLNDGGPDWVLRTRRRPKESSTNAAITRPIFGSAATMELPIPKAIDAYNHYMGGIDQANQIRGQGYTCHRPYEVRNWRPLAYWLFDVCHGNAYAIWLRNQSEKVLKARHSHEVFQKVLISQLLSRGMHHKPGQFDKRRRCAWGAKHPQDCQQTKQKRPYAMRTARSGLRVPLAEVKQPVRPVKRSRNIISGCIPCGVHLCIKKGCFIMWHENLLANVV
jgi:hypothetical protein